MTPYACLAAWSAARQMSNPLPPHLPLPASLDYVKCLLLARCIILLTTESSHTAYSSHSPVFTVHMHVGYCIYNALFLSRRTVQNSQETNRGSVATDSFSLDGLFQPEPIGTQ